MLEQGNYTELLHARSKPRMLKTGRWRSDCTRDLLGSPGQKVGADVGTESQ